MASTVTLSGDFASLIGGNPSRVRAYVETNIPAGEALIDTTRNLVLLGNYPITVDTDGTFALAGLVSTSATDLNVAADTLQYRVVASYISSAGTAGTWTSGWFFLPASADVADVAATAVPVTAVVTSDSVVAGLIQSPTSATNDALEGLFAAKPTNNVLDDETPAHRGVFGSSDAILMADNGNVGFGRNVFGAGAATTLASTAIGHAAGELLTDGDNETFVGYAAGQRTTTGNHNTYVGSYAAFQASGNYNTAVGSRALCGPNWNVPATTGVENTAVGYEALSTLSSGQRNTAVGFEAGAGMGAYLPISNVTYAGTTVTVTITDTGALAVGSLILVENVGGVTNVNGSWAIATIPNTTQFTYTATTAPTGTYTSGGTALGGSLTGSNNVSIGHYAAFTNQRGSNNIAVGNDALRKAENSSNNVAVGYAALNNTTTGHSNVAYGTNAGFSLTTGPQNTFIGRDAGYTATPANATTTASGQTCVGYQAGLGSATQHVHITAIGSASRVTGNYGTAVGRSTHAQGNGSVAIGCDSTGVGAAASGTDSFVLGTATHRYKMPGLPTVNPGAGTGILWNDAGTVKVA